MSSCGVEVPEKSAGPVRVSRTNILEYFFHEELSLAVWVCAVASRMFFIHRKILRLAIHCGAGAEHDLLHAELHHHLHQVGAPCHVVAVVLQG